MPSPSLRLRPFDVKPDSTLELRADVSRARDHLEFDFLLTGSRADLDRVVWPAAKPPAKRERRDELWKTTCLELFVSTPESASYVEMNVTPAGDWALYEFDGYRAGMRAASGEVVVHVPPANTEPYFRLVGSVKVDVVLAPGDLVFGATAVMECRSGEREYWALRHAGAKPDFHLRESFTERLPRAGTP
jgi:hypothetical protein